MKSNVKCITGYSVTYQNTMVRTRSTPTGGTMSLSMLQNQYKPMALDGAENVGVAVLQL